MIQDLDVINFFICRVQPSITFLHHVIPSFPESILLGFTSGASFIGPSIFTFSSMVIALDHKVHSCDILHNSPYLGPAHIPRLSPRGQKPKTNHILPFWWWPFPVTSSCRYQQPPCMFTHHPKISVVKGLHIFKLPSESLHLSERFPSQISLILWMLIVFIMVAYDLFHPHTFHSYELSIRVLQL